MPPESLIASADYADALIAARRAIRILAAIVILVLVGQIALFFTYRYRIPADGAIAAPAVATSQPPTATSQPAATAPSSAEMLIEYGIGLTQFFAMGASISLSMALLVTLNIMILARVVGIAPVARALFASLPLIVLLFPWQAILNNHDMTAVDFKVPGVLYSWSELTHLAHWTDPPFSQAAALHWARFAGFPCVALLLVITVYMWTVRGLSSALAGAAATGNGVRNSS